MDDSQSSDVFSETTVEDDHSAAMDTNTYEILLSRLKFSSCKDKKCISAKYFNEVLQDCETCVYQCLNTIESELEDINLIEFNKLCEHIENAICLLQMFSNFNKSVLECIALACCTMKTYPKVTGNIILSVFTHCKDSECLYGVNINKVAKQLKDLFRTCHELQLTYLMSMEKHYTFDLSEKDELDILLEALDINMKIGEVVQALDIKTMAEQWKAFTAICEKYSRYLLDKHIYNKCTRIFIDMIRNNMKSVLEMKHDDKAIVRYVKVASFGIKILSKICSVFKNGTSNEHEDVLDTVIYLFMFNNSYLEMISKSQHWRLIESNITVSLDVLLGQLMDDRQFLDCVCNMGENKIQEEAYLGFVILLTRIMKSLHNETEVNDIKVRILKRLFWSLPFGHIIFNMGLKFKTIGECGQYSGIFEYLLAESVAFAKTLKSQQYSVLERIMLESILDTDCYRGIFAGNLWVLLLRSCDPKLLSNTLMSLLRVYQKVTNIHLFQSSPQRVYLAYTLRKLFENCSPKDKMLIYQQYNVQDDVDVWIALRLSNLPPNVQIDAEQLVLDKLLKVMNGLGGGDEDIDCMVKLMDLAATCTNNDQNMNDLLLRLWGKVCPKCSFDVKKFDSSSIWYFRYVEGLMALTETVRERMPSNVKAKILHTMARILMAGNTELVYLLFRSFCDLYPPKGFTQNDLLHDVFEKLLSDDVELRQYVFSVVQNRPICTEMYRIMQQDAVDAPTEYIEYRRPEHTLNIRNKLISVAKNTFSHKCLSKVCSKRTSKSNFDFADIDSLFDNDSDNEPASKKVKLSVNEIEDLILRLEEDASLLCEVNDALSEEHKARISNVCIKFKNIIED